MTEEAKEMVARLRDLMAKATLLPWKEHPGHYRAIQGAPAPGEKYGTMVTTLTGAIAKQQGYGKDNARFIVEAVNALPTLLDLVDRLVLTSNEVKAGKVGQEPADDVERRAVARCIEIIREVSEGFLSPEYATGQPISSFNERFACSQCAEAIENKFAIGTLEQRRLLGKPTPAEEYRATLTGQPS